MDDDGRSKRVSILTDGWRTKAPQNQKELERMVADFNEVVGLLHGHALETKDKYVGKHACLAGNVLQDANIALRLHDRFMLRVDGVQRAWKTYELGVQRLAADDVRIEFPSDSGWFSETDSCPEYELLASHSYAKLATTKAKELESHIHDCGPCQELMRVDPFLSHALLFERD